MDAVSESSLISMCKIDALMHVHKNILININNIVDRFAKNKHKTDFVIKLTVCLYFYKIFLQLRLKVLV